MSDSAINNTTPQSPAMILALAHADPRVGAAYDDLVARAEGLAGQLRDMTAARDLCAAEARLMVEQRDDARRACALALATFGEVLISGGADAKDALRGAAAGESPPSGAKMVLLGHVLHVTLGGFDAVSIEGSGAPTAYVSPQHRDELLRRWNGAPDRDAARWRALVGSPKMHMMGHAGFTLEGDVRAGADYQHMGLEFWSAHGYEQAKVQKETDYVVRLLTNYADAIIARDGASAPKAGPTCGICKRPLSQTDDPSTEDCGGDCLKCMADAGDPECVEAMNRIAEPAVVSATVRDGNDDWHIECRFADGQKFAAVQVDREFEGLAHRIANALPMLSARGEDV